MTTARRHALVIGASRGIGAAVATEPAAAGHAVAVARLASERAEWAGGAVLGLNGASHPR
ncbi:hypothetical protein [Streptomyces sp. NPDC058751]|uniref:hypothetical protein n=1 Tax=Streptomyces sp. NPDC058751 TaxID=3346623 RepID=UPI00367DABA0